MPESCKLQDTMKKFVMLMIYLILVYLCTCFKYSKILACCIANSNKVDCILYIVKGYLIKM